LGKCKRRSLFYERSPGSLWLLVGGILQLLLGSEASDDVLIDLCAVFEFPDLAVSHKVDDFKLSYEVIDEELDDFNSEIVLQFFHVVGFIDEFHDILGSLLIVDAIDAGFGEADAELF
jgi:hypothetical protein